MTEPERRSNPTDDAGKLAGALVHEIRNPLNTLSLNLQLLAEEWRQAESERDRRALRRIQRLLAETRRLAAMLDDFLDLVRGHKLAPAPADVNALVGDVVTFIRPEAEASGIRIRESYGSAPACMLDADLIKQALLNLILNAEQAMAESETRELIIRTSAEADDVRIDVIDTGRGIPPDVSGKIFEPFFSTRKGGTGLGLAMARRVVEEHGGHISVVSEPGRGSCFTVHLPVPSGVAPKAGKEIGGSVHGG